MFQQYQPLRIVCELGGNEHQREILRRFIFHPWEVATESGPLYLQLRHIEEGKIWTRTPGNQSLLRAG